MNRRFRHFAIGILAVMALATSSVSACACSHHQPKQSVDAKSCHGTHQQHGAHGQTGSPQDTADADCTCVSLNLASAGSVSEIKPLRLNADAVPAIENDGFAILVATSELQPQLAIDRLNLSYSNVLTALLPSRAPPRL